MASIKNLLTTPKDTLKIEWSEIENKIGFKLNDNLKDFYSRIICKSVKGIVDFSEEKFIKPTGNNRNDTWFSFNECEGNVEFKLYPLSSLKNVAEYIERAFNVWTGGNDFGHRAMIGEFYFNIGQILILLNNDTGKVEWIDCGYGYFDTYEENPNGILADNIQEFFDMF